MANVEENLLHFVGVILNRKGLGDKCVDVKEIGVHLEGAACGASPSRSLNAGGNGCELLRGQFVAILKNDEIAARRTVYADFGIAMSDAVVTTNVTGDPPEITVAPARRGWVQNTPSLTHLLGLVAIATPLPSSVVGIDIMCFERRFANEVTLQAMSRRRSKPLIRKGDRGVVCLRVEVEL